ncbi:uncharacterized protein J3D65DRAFT_226174 [Phyllosticta citribraziliensis]|uniref:Uncharacterized protein n=1 Tax=Phyllosticta citribraziliensis TaxID=989973 RepID=A0ABR1M6Y2_9PEZI
MHGRGEVLDILSDAALLAGTSTNTIRSGFLGELVCRHLPFFLFSPFLFPPPRLRLSVLSLNLLRTGEFYLLYDHPFAPHPPPSISSSPSPSSFLHLRHQHYLFFFFFFLRGFTLLLLGSAVLFTKCSTATSEAARQASKSAAKCRRGRSVRADRRSYKKGKTRRQAGHRLGGTKNLSE